MNIDELASLSSEEKIRLLRTVFHSLEPIEQVNFIQDIVEHIKINSEIKPSLLKYGRRIGEGYLLIIKDMLYNLKKDYNEAKHLQVCLLIEGAPLFGINMPEDIMENYKKIRC